MIISFVYLGRLRFSILSLLWLLIMYMYKYVIVTVCNKVSWNLKLNLHVSLKSNDRHTGIQASEATCSLLYYQNNSLINMNICTSIIVERDILSSIHVIGKILSIIRLIPVCMSTCMHALTCYL